MIACMINPKISEYGLKEAKSDFSVELPAPVGGSQKSRAQAASGIRSFATILYV
jgi:hypothetical protein